MKAGSAASVTEATNIETLNNVSSESDVRLGRHVAASIITACLSILTVLHAALPGSSFEVFSPRVKQAVSALAPEGWAFFTRSARLPTPVPYQYGSDGRWRSLSVGPLARPGNAMGVDRAGRAQGTEVATLLDPVPRGVWHRCERDPLVCLTETSVDATVANTSHRTICGDVGFVIQEVLPWAWRNSPTIMPSKVVRVHVTC
jgi:antimicrobial peptide system SdpA family protein